MKNIVSFMVALVTVWMFHDWLFSHFSIKQTVISLPPQKKISSIINLQRVSIKALEPMIEPVKKEVIPTPLKRVEKPKTKKSKTPRSVKKKEPTKKRVVKKKRLKKKPQKKVQKHSSEAELSTPQQKKIKNNYINTIQHMIEQHKHYPRMAKKMGHEGVVYIQFTVHKNGRISHILVVKKSGYNSLDKATLKSIHGIGNFPPIPKKLGKNRITFTVPINYKIR